jgi:hypothetical protein
MLQPKPQWIGSSRLEGGVGGPDGGGEWVVRLLEVGVVVVGLVAVECFVEYFLVECFEVLAVECFFVLVDECLAVAGADVQVVIELFRVLVVLIVELSGVSGVEASVVELSTTLELSVTTLVVSVLGLTPTPCAAGVEFPNLCQSMQRPQSPH